MAIQAKTGSTASKYEKYKYLSPGATRAVSTRSNTMAMFEIGFGSFADEPKPIRKCISSWMDDPATKQYTKYYLFLNRLGSYAAHENRFLEEIIVANIAIMHELYRVKEPDAVRSALSYGNDADIGELRASIKTIQLHATIPKYKKELAQFEKTVYSESYQDLMLRGLRSRNEACVAYSAIYGYESVHTRYTKTEVIYAVPAVMSVIGLTKADCAGKPALCALIGKIEAQMKLEGI